MNEPEWSWSGTSSAKANFTVSDEDVFTTVDASISSSTVTASKCTENDKVTYTASAAINGKTYTDTKTVDGNAGPHSYTYSVSGDTITETCSNNCGHSAAAKLTATNARYTGSAIENVAAITYSDDWQGEKPTEISYANNINASTEDNPATASITVEGKEVSTTFQITRVDITEGDVTLEPNSGYYKGSAYEPEISVIWKGATLVKDRDYVVSWDKTGFETPDIYTARITGINNFTGYVLEWLVIWDAYLSGVKVAAEDLTYNGSAQKPTVHESAVAVNGQPVTFTYSTDKYGTYGDLPTFTEAGDYTVYYKASAPYHQNSPVGKFTVTVHPKEIDISWGETTDLVYTGNSLVPTAAVANLEDGDTCILTTEVVEETEGAGIIPGNWTAKVTALSNDNYKLPENVSASFQIVNASQDAPDVTGENETIDGKADGKITGLDSTMEYRKEGEDTYTAISGTELTDFEDGTYYVRYVAKTYYNPSPDTKVVINAGRKLTVTVPQDQVGYTLSVDKTELEYNGDFTITLMIHDGYYKTEDFAVKLNGSDMNWGDFTELEIQSITENVMITVEGVAKSNDKAVLDQTGDAANQGTASPATGDNSSLWLWFALLFISGGALAGISMYGRKKNYRVRYTKWRY